MPIAARSYQGSSPTSRISLARNECAVRMIAPTLNGFLARSIAIRNGWRIRSSSARTSERGRSSCATFKSLLPLHRAADRRIDVVREGPAFQRAVDGGPQIVALHLLRALGAVVDAAGVDELALAIEDERVGSAGGAE